MVAHGTLIGFLGDWLEHMHLCIRLPSKNMLLISDPIPNPLVPNESIVFSERDRMEIIQSSKDAIFKKFDDEDHPWQSPHGTTVLDVMASATMTALQLVCKANRLEFDNGDDLFVKCSEEYQAWDLAQQAALAWKMTVDKYETQKQKCLSDIRSTLSSIFDKNGGNGPSQNKDDDKDPASGGNGLSFLGPPFFAFCQAPLIFSLRPGPLPEMGPWAIKSFEQ